MSPDASALKSPPSLPPIVVDPATGHMTLWGIPTWLMSPQYHAEMQAELETLSGKAARGILYRVAFRSGQRAVQGLALQATPGASAEETVNRLRRLEAIALAAGHGFSEVAAEDLGKRQVTWTMKHSLLAMMHVPSKEGVCHYYEGFLAGFVSAVLASPVEAREIECRAKGDGRCVIRTKPTAAPPV